MTTAPNNWNPRYLAYCAGQGRDPGAQLRHDRERFPGGVMCGYIIWSGGTWGTWRRLNGGSDVASRKDQAGYDLMLAAMAGGHSLDGIAGR